MTGFFINGALLIGLLVAISLLGLYVASGLYGIYLSFKKKWYIGAISLIVPGFSLVVGIAKLIFKKDLLK